MKLETSPAKYTRSGVEDGVYWYVSDYSTRTSSPRARVFVRNELTPLQERFKEINDWLGMEVIRFKDYNIEAE